MSFVQRYRHQLVAAVAMAVGIGILAYGLNGKDIKGIVSGGVLIALSLIHVFRMLRIRAPPVVTSSQSSI